MPRSTAWLTIILSLFTLSLNGQYFPASLIADSLKENAHAVIREYTREIELQGVNRGTEKVRKVITVLDDNGDDFGNLSIFYDKDSKVTIKQAAIYDKTGKRVKKINQSDISDSPASDGGTLYSDNRVKTYHPNYGDYPYSVEYEFELNNSNLISYAKWYPFYGYNVSLEHAKLTFIYPSDLIFKKKEMNICSPSEKVNQGNKISESWRCQSVRAIEYEPYAISLSERLPKVLLMPVTLIWDNFSGNAGNWQEYGKWISDLYQGRDALPESDKAKLAKLVGNTTDTLGKIKLMYRFMQENTRYVGIQLGIGGLQPFPAGTVSETGYGDCKALTNYMHAMLKLYGIKSYPALVSSGSYIEPIYKDFPNFQQFDHVILCIPQKQDTIWLECTNQNIQFGFLGDFTDDRDVLLITEDGGKMAHTRRYSAGDNLLVTHAEFAIDPKGEANCTIKTKYRALQYFDIFGVFYSTSDDQKKWIYQNSSLPSQQLTAFSFSHDDETLPQGTVNKSFISKNYCSFTGNYMLLPLNMVNSLAPVKKLVRERKSDFIIHRSTIDYDTLVYTIPDTYKIESVPSGKKIKSPFGDYSYTVAVKENKIIYTRKLEIDQGLFKASEYKNFYDFFMAVSKADNDKAMLVKK